MTMNRTLSVFTRWRFSIAVVLALFALSAAGCGPTETPAPPKETAAPKETTASTPTETTPKTKGGAPKSDTTSRRELQRQRAAERAKSGQSP
jgi:hypothetical protein